jgi:hypothetical protein
MKILAIVTALVAANVPTLTLAMCTGHEEQSASSCKQGYVWDGSAQACVEQTNS